MAVFTLCPYEQRQYFDDNGDPLAFGKVNTYITGTTTPVFTYADSTGTLNTNPVVLDASGRARIYLDPTVTYKFILTDANNVPVGLSMDPVNPSPTTITATTFSAGAGSVGAPSYTFTGDTNTGLFHPIAETVAVVTNGVERLRVTAAGGLNLGGTAEPGAKNLVVEGTSQLTGNVIVNGTTDLLSAVKIGSGAVTLAVGTPGGGTTGSGLGAGGLITGKSFAILITFGALGAVATEITFGTTYAAKPMVFIGGVLTAAAGVTTTGCTITAGAVAAGDRGYLFVVGVP